jgi:hypothetical protein
MSTINQSNAGPLSGLGSLIDDPALLPPEGKARGKKGGVGGKKGAREPFQVTVTRLWGNGKNRYRSSKRFRIATWITAAVVLGGGGYGLYEWLRPVPVPDYDTAPMSSVLDFTFLTDEFNKLPVEQRVTMIGSLVKRIRSMDGRESMLMAGFAAGLTGKAREQLEENASRLMLDVMDNFAVGYTAVPVEEKEAFIESKVVEMVRLMTNIAGEENTQTDEEILADARRQAERDQNFMRSGNFTGDMAGRTFTTLNNGIGKHSSPHQKARVGNFLRDMTRHLRDQDVNTGKARPKPTPPAEAPAPGPG